MAALMVPGATLPRLAECRDCHEPIRFVTMEQSGRAMPVNPMPTDHHEPGNVAARLRGHTLLGHVVTDSAPGTHPHPYRFTPHWRTCQQRKTPPTTEPADAPLF